MKKIIIGLVFLAAVCLGSFAQQGTAHFKDIQRSLKNTNSSVVMIAAHRGAHLNVPENSLPAVKEAINLGIDIVEADVRFTKDKQLVIMHDKTITRTSNGKGSVSDFTFEEIRKFRLKFKDSLTQETIPSLEEVLLAAKGKILIDLDIKQDECIDSIMALVTRTHTENNCLFFVYDPQLGKMIKAKNAYFHLLVRTENALAVDTLFSVVRPEAVHIDPGHYTSTVIHTLKNGKSRVWINALGDVDKKAAAGNPNAYEEVLKFGANIIQTDQPALLKKYLESKGQYYRK